MKQIVVSREWKVMLKTTRFYGSRSTLQKAAQMFWRSFSNSIEGIAIGVDGSLTAIEKQKTVSFYDTGGRHLHSNNYLFRERVDVDAEEREVTLKFRHPDRYVSQDRDMASARPEEGVTKFEEDIKLPFTTLYSFSTTQPISRGKTLDRLRDVVALYPGIKKRLGSVPKDEPIEIVGSFIAREIVIAGASFRLERKPKREAECALIVWYGDAGQEDKPVVVEFSFRYGNKHEEYERDAALRAYDAFGAMQKSLADWIDPDAATKTAFVYEQTGKL